MFRQNIRCVTSWRHIVLTALPKLFSFQFDYGCLSIDSSLCLCHFVTLVIRHCKMHQADQPALEAEPDDYEYDSGM